MNNAIRIQVNVNTIENCTWEAITFLTRYKAASEVSTHGFFRTLWDRSHLNASVEKRIEMLKGRILSTARILNGMHELDMNERDYVALNSRRLEKAKLLLANLYEYIGENASLFSIREQTRKDLNEITHSLYQCVQIMDAKVDMVR